MSPKLVILLWDSVGLDDSGDLISDASFVRVLEELRHLTPLLLICSGKGRPVEGKNIRIAKIGMTPTFSMFLRNPSVYKLRIAETIKKELSEIPPTIPVLMIDATLPNAFASHYLLSRKTFLYLRGDDVREARIRHRGIARAGAFIHSIILDRVRHYLVSHFEIIGAGERPLPSITLTGHVVWPFYPSTITQMDLSQLYQLGHESYQPTLPLRIAWVGRVISIKRLDRLLKAAELFARLYKNQVQLDIYGDGPMLKKYKKTSEQTDPYLKVNFYGYVSNLEIIRNLSGALCLAISSDWEGFPKVVPEALSVGVPIVSFDIGSISALIEKRDIGIVVKGGERDMAEAFLLLATSKETRQIKSKNALNTALSLTIDSQCQSLLKYVNA